MTIHYGKRNPGALTAASPGDTLYIPLQFYNDSGASISIGNTLAVTDIEVFKDGSVTQRATDSGYAILGDTGNFDNRIGFKGISISLFNTADDANFYAVGSTYWVAIDSVTVDARTVRFFPAVFEIGENRANVVQIDGDTGAADQLGKAFATTPTYFQQVDVQQIDADTGAADVLQKFADTTGALSPAGELDTGSGTLISVGSVTGAVGSVTGAVGSVTATVTANVDQIDGDTGAADLLQKAFDTTPAYFQQVDVQQVDGDTGAADVLQKFADTTGALSPAGELDTGSGTLISVGSVTGSVGSVTGAVGSVTGAVGSVTAVVTANVDQLDGDTGAADQLQKAFDTTPAYFQQVDVQRIIADTGAARHIAQLADEYDTGRLPAEATATLDTGGIHAAVWQVPSGNANRTLTNIDTGAAIHLAQMADEYDTGRLPADASATVDTGAVANAIWNSLRADHVGAGTFGQYVISDMQYVDGDTGPADNLGRIAEDTGSDSYLWRHRDTGGIASAVWAKDTRILTSFAFDTGVSSTIWAAASRTLTANTNLAGVSVNVTQINSDTGAAAHVAQAFAAQNTNSDTGLIANAAAIRTKTDSLTFTVAGQVDSNTQYVNDVQIQGIGDTGTANTWRPA